MKNLEKFTTLFVKTIMKKVYLSRAYLLNELL